MNEIRRYRNKTKQKKIEGKSNKKKKKKKEGSCTYRTFNRSLWVELQGLILKKLIKEKQNKEKEGKKNKEKNKYSFMQSNPLSTKPKLQK